MIECVEAQNKKVLFCLNDGECLEVLDTFVHCSNELTTNDAFYKCHRSYLVHNEMLVYNHLKESIVFHKL